ncbi:MAG: DUF6229 family protein [Caulobacteraceae bacterium]
MIELNAKQEDAQNWRLDIDAGNPAGSLFTGGEFAAADIASDSRIVTTSTVTICAFC